MGWRSLRDAMASAIPPRTSATDPTQLTKLLKSELGDYMEYQMGLEKLTALFPPGFNVLDTNGPWLEFTKVPEPGRSVPEFGRYLAGLGTPLDPAILNALDERIHGGHLYVHQEKSIEAILRGESVILPHPTGTGKTECFVVPILNYLLEQIQQKEKKTYGLGCIMIFPTKALENDQRDRLKEFLFVLERSHGQRIPWIGVYDGDTPRRTDFARFSQRRHALMSYAEECPKCHQDNLGYEIGQKDHLLWCDNSRKTSRGEPIGCGYPRPDHPNGIPWIRTTREDMSESEHFPNLLITNPESLDYRLLSGDDVNVFRTRMSRVVIVIDEAHAYDASSCLGFRVLLSRLEQKLRDVNGQNLVVQYVISSATLDDPQNFARRLIPWILPKVIDFVQKPDPFPKEHADAILLDGAIVPIDPGAVDWIFETVGKPPSNTPEVQTLLRLRVVRLSDGVLKPGSSRILRAWSLWTLESSSIEARELLAEDIRSNLVATLQAQEIFKRVQSEPATLAQLSEWWVSTWHGFSTEMAADTITALVFIGRKVHLWTERWHLFIRTPTGFAGCIGPTFHPFRISAEEPLLEACPHCAGAIPVLEMMTCQQCGEIYHLVYVCKQCDPPTLWSSPEVGCGHDPTPQAAILQRKLCLGATVLSTLFPQVRLINRTGKNKCDTCDELLVETKRRSDQLIEMSVSLIGWHADSRRRKFLLFSDGRASSERISREFNNQEKVLWVERLIMNIMLRDVEHTPHDPRSLAEVRLALNRELRGPYSKGLRPVLSRYEWERLDESLGLCVAMSLGKSSYGDSRLFRMGLLGYAFPDEVLERSRDLGLEEVLPRVVDLIRLKASYEKGIGQTALFQWFTGTGHARRRIHQTAAAHLTDLAGPNHQNLQNALSVLQNCGWISREVDATKKIPETYYWFREGEAGDDPFEDARDPRLVEVPREVSRCPTCSFVRWYRLAFCENCGTAMTVVSHEELLANDYFTRILVQKPIPIVSAVHRAGLDPLERRALEERFQAEENSIHLLCATPTLELGVDIGYLNFVILAKVPPTRSSYIQRVGRAGRRQDEGAICLTFAYPTPVDSYYFHHPQPLVAMRSSRVPVQRLSKDQLGPFIWATALDCYSSRRSTKANSTFEGNVTTRQFLELRAPLKPSEFGAELSALWEATLAPYVQTVLKRCLVPLVDRVDEAALSVALVSAKSCVDDPTMLNKTLLQTESFSSQRDEIEKLHLSISKSITKLRQKSSRTNDEFDKLRQLETEDENIKEYKKSHMMSSPILRYLHDCGAIPSPRGIGGSVLAYDLQSMDRVLDDRPFDIAVFDRFPGALISRQGAIYQVRKIVYDPIASPTILDCPVCHSWLDEETTRCPDHPDSDPRELVLRRPVVAFASLTSYRNRETVGLQESRLRYRGPHPAYDDHLIGSLPVAVSVPVDLDIASFCSSYSILEGGRTLDFKDEILVCGNCGNLPDEEANCCDSPLPQTVVQGQIYTTRAVNFRLEDAVLDARLAKAIPSDTSPPAESREEVAQSLAFALLNALAITLDIEPTMFDAWRGADNSIWIYEPAPGGFGILDDLRKDAGALSRVLDEVRSIVQTRPGDHECQRFCDQCLIVPRKAFDVVRLLNRPKLEAVMQ
jgi:DEAD/DEAH box helicase/Helicase conserved C-terminal domain